MVVLKVLFYLTLGFYLFLIAVLIFITILGFLESRNETKKSLQFTSCFSLETYFKHIDQVSKQLYKERQIFLARLEPITLYWGTEKFTAGDKSQLKTIYINRKNLPKSTQSVLRRVGREK